MPFEAGSKRCSLFKDTIPLDQFESLARASSLDGAISEVVVRRRAFPVARTGSVPTMSAWYWPDRYARAGSALPCRPPGRRSLIARNRRLRRRLPASSLTKMKSLRQSGLTRCRYHRPPRLPHLPRHHRRPEAAGSRGSPAGPSSRRPAGGGRSRSPASDRSPMPCSG